MPFHFKIRGRHCLIYHFLVNIKIINKIMKSNLFFLTIILIVFVAIAHEHEHEEPHYKDGKHNPE